MKAMIFAAGLGTRLKPLTNHTPKAMVPVLGKPLLEHLILKLKKSGVRQLVVNVHHFPDQIINFLNTNNHFGLEIHISDERDRLLDTGGGLKYASDFLRETPFFVHNVDVFSNVDFAALMDEHLSVPDRLATLVVSSRETNRYLLFDANNRLQGWANVKTKEIKPDVGLDVSKLNNLAFSGIQVVSPAAVKLMERESDRFSIIDFYLKYCNSHFIGGMIPDEFKMLDVGKPDTILEAEHFLSSL